MPEFLWDRKDLDFLLYEQLDVNALTALPRYEDMNRELFDSVLDGALQIAREVLAPNREEVDAKGCRLEGGQVQVPEAYVETYKQYAEGGWIAVQHEPELGGMGLPLVLALAVNEMSMGADTSFMFYPGLTVAAAHLIEVYASSELRELVVPKMYGGEWTGTMCLTEPGAGTAVGDLRTIATPIEGSDRYAIKGNKIFISAGDHQLTDNIMHLVLARVPGDPAGTKGISLFLVPKFRFDAQGQSTGSNDVVTTAIEHKMGINGSATCSLSFGDNDACEGILIGERCRGIVAMFQMMNEARIACGLQGSATANYAYHLALSYAKERVQGAKVTDRSPDAKAVPIIDHPDVRRNLMICKAYAEGMRALLYNTAMYGELAQRHPDEAVREKNQSLVDLLTPICKAYASDKAFKVTELAIQIHGGYGYISEYGVEQCMRDVKIASIYEGTNGIQALDLLGRKMRLKGGGLFMTWMQDLNDFVEEHREHERLGSLATRLEQAKNTLGEVAFGFMSREDFEQALLGATPFLELFGHVEMARLWLQRAALADKKLQALYMERDARDEEAQKALIRSVGDAKFYDGQVKTAQFFFATILPEIDALAQDIQSGDRSALDICF